MLTIFWDVDGQYEALPNVRTPNAGRSLKAGARLLPLDEARCRGSVRVLPLAHRVRTFGPVVSHYYLNLIRLVGTTARNAEI